MSTDFNIQTMDRDEVPMFRSWLQEHLRAGVVTVHFTKTDGDARVMRCTLQEGVVPVKVVAEDAPPKTRKTSADTLAVWDVERGDWRSFRLDRVTKVVLIGGEQDVVQA